MFRTLFFTLSLLLLCSISYAQTPNTATITFPAVTTYTDGTAITDPITYNVYQGLEGQPTVKVGTIVSGGNINTGLLTGKKYCWQVTAVVKTVEGAKSVIDPVKSCKDFAGVPGLVVITVT